MNDLHNGGDINVNGDFIINDSSHNIHKPLNQCTNEELLNEQVYRNNLLDNEKAPILLKDNNETNLTFVDTMIINDNKLYVGDDKGLFVYSITTDGALTLDKNISTPQPIRKIKFYDSNIIISCSADNKEDDNTTGIIILNSDLI